MVMTQKLHWITNSGSALALAVAAGFVTPAHADSVFWSGGVDNNWFNNGNWVWDGHTPAAGDQARIDATGVEISGSSGSVGTLFVGLSGTATLDVTSGLASDNVAIGYNVGSDGTITFTGAGATWTNSGSIYVGESGAGLVDMLAGSSGSSDQLFIGSGIGSGTVNLSDGSSFDILSNLYVGYGGTGTLNILSGSDVTADLGIIADGVSSSGNLTVDGGGSTLTFTGNLAVGGGGVGSMVVSDGAVVDVDGVASIADLASASGSDVTVTGNGSTWSVGGILYTGVSGDGELTVEDRGLVEATTLYAGFNSASEGTVRVDNGSIDVSDRIGIGYSGEGSLLIENGGDVTSNGAILGWNASGSGSATITGGSSRWDNTGVLFVGNLGDGDLSVLAGADVTSTDGYVGTENGSDSSATVSGSGSSWIMSGAFFVAHNNGSTGEVTIGNGGKVSSLQGIIGDLSGAEGTMTVTGSGSLWEARVDSGVLYSGDLNVGRHGDGDLTVSAGGSVVGNRLHIANETGSSGSVLVSGSGSNITIADRLSVGLDGDGALTVRNGGTITADSVKIASDAGSKGRLNIGAAAGKAAAAAGIIDTDLIKFGNGDGEIVFNHTSSAYDFGADVTGDGVMSFLSGTTILSGNYTGYTGAIEINGGMLNVNTSTLDAVATILSGATLGGTGTLGNVLVSDGGTVAPGNSIGTLTVADITFSSGSIYSVEIDDTGASDLLYATGTATIDSRAELEFGPENGTDDGTTYTPGTVYTVLTADGGLTGRFDIISSDFAFLNGVMSYDANNAYLTVNRNTSNFADLGTTRNQIAVGTALDSLASGTTLYNIASSLLVDEVEAAYDSLSGEVHASTKGILLNDSAYVRDALNDRMIESRDGKDMSAFWISSYGGWSDLDGDGNAASATRSVGGFVAGVDADLAASWTLGLAGGYSRSSISVDDRASDATSDNYTVGLYGGTVQGPVAVRLGTAFTWHDIEVDRTVDAGALNEDLSSGYSAYTSQVFAEAGYMIETGEARFEPFAGLAYVHLKTDSFEESSGTASLSGSSSSESVGFSTIGVRAGSEVELGGVPLLLSGSLAWKHLLGGDTPSADLAFAGSDAFTVQGVPMARDVAAVEAGIGFVVSPAATVSLSYAGQFASGLAEHQAKARFEIKF